jgi:hypothetical protein
MSAVFSRCGTFRYRLERDVGSFGPVYAYFGVNCSTADHRVDDNTVKRWIGLTKAYGGSRFIVGNAFAFRSPHVKDLDSALDPVGPENDEHLARIIADAEILVPCWGRQIKVPPRLRYRFAEMETMLRASGKPIKVFGLSKAGDPLHPLMLPYSTVLIDWVQARIMRATVLFADAQAR